MLPTAPPLNGAVTGKTSYKVLLSRSLQMRSNEGMPKNSESCDVANVMPFIDVGLGSH